jgi:hypothetical protein
MKRRLLGRRDFIKSSGASLGGLIYLASDKKGGEKQQKERKFIYRTLGKTGIKLPIISMGIMNPYSDGVVRAALDAGIIHLDTAAHYSRGRVEEMIGEVIKGRNRESLFIATKINLPRDMGSGKYMETATTQEFLNRLDNSLGRLGLGYVDILYLHEIYTRDAIFYEPILKGFEKAKKEGKIRLIGVSTHSEEPEVIQAAIDSKFYEVILTAYNFTQIHHLKVREAIAKAAKAGLGVIAMKVMGGGRYEARPSKVDGKAALKWVLQDPNVHTTLPGFTSFEEMELDLSVMEDLTLTDPEKEYLQKHAAMRGFYCQGCRQCIKQCLFRLPIPDMMRAYMYTYAYRNLPLAQETLLSLGLPQRICEDCESCLVKCSVGFDIPQKIRNIMRLRDVPEDFLA